MKTHAVSCCPNRTRAWTIGAALALSFLSAGGLYGQDAEPPEQKPAEAQPAPPQAIPLAQVAVQAQQASEIVDELKALTVPDPKLDTILVGLGALEDSLKFRRSQPEFQNLERLSQRSITDLNSRWKGYQAQVQDWETRLLEKSGEIADAVERLNQLSGIWSATADTARAARAPRVLQRQIQTALSVITRAHQELEGRFRRVLSLQEAVTSSALPLKDDIKRIDARRDELERQIFVVDAPPLWEALSQTEDSTGVVRSIRQSWSAAIEATASYLSLNTDRATLHLVISGLFFGLFLLLRRQVGAMAATEPLPAPLPDALQLLRRPLAAALLVLVFLVRYFYPDAPVGLTDFFRIIVVIPFLILALFWFRSEMRAMVIALAVIYLLELTRQLIADDPGAARLLLLVQGVAGLAVITFGLRSGGVLRTAGAIPMANLVRRLTVVALVLLVGAIGANVMGSVSLARRLTTGVTMSAASAIFYGIIVLLADGALFFAVKAWMTRVSRLMRRFADLILRFAMRLLALAGLIAWILGALGAFDLRGIVVGGVEEAIATEWGIGSVQVSVGDMLLFAVLLAGSFVLARVLRLTLEEEFFSRVSLPRGFPGAIAMVVRYSVVGLGIVLALAALGLDLGKFGLLAGALGVGLGFGLQHVVANFVSGIILAFERPIQVGDMVQLGGLWGTISSIGVRSTRVRSFDGSEVVIPNNDLISKEVTNWTLSDRLRRLAFPVKVEFGSEPRTVIETMLKAVREHEVPLNSPEPFVIFEGLGEYFLEFTLYFWITTDKYLAGKNEVGMAVLEALKQVGIQIPSAPHRITIDDRRHPRGEGPPKEGPITGASPKA
jgi:potassium efflux system protein